MSGTILHTQPTANSPSDIDMTTRSVELPVEGPAVLKVDIKIPSANTKALRKKVTTFIKASYTIWKSLPESDTGLVATTAALDEVIYAAAAFHANSEGKVDLIWIKKDMPKEALNNPEAGYWRGTAGSAAQTEQLELQNIREIPQPVVDHIRNTNDHDFIAHYLYAFIDFWCIVLRHWIIWLGCIFFYGFLCIIEPTIIVAESSKLINLFNQLTPGVIFQPNIPEADFQAFLNGIFTFEFLQGICIITQRKWKDLALESDDYLQAVGNPLVVRYGPLSQHCAIFIPKYHPYGASHNISVAITRDSLDREIRLLLERALVIVQAAGPLPSGSERRTMLLRVRQAIMLEATRLGIMGRMEKLKNEMRQAHLAFIGTSTAAVARTTGASTGDGQNPNAYRGLTALRAEGEKQSDARKAWTIQQINVLREKMESGQNIGLLACPPMYAHGSIDHARWLFRTVKEDADIINAACATALNNPLTAEQLQALNVGHDRCGLERKNDTNTISATAALQALSQQPKDRPSRVDIFRVDCPHCKRVWIINNTPFPAHKCLALLKNVILPLRDSIIQSRSHIETEAAQTSLESAPSYSTGVTRCLVSATLTWSLGERVAADDAIWKQVESVAKERHRDPKPSEPAYIRAIDLRGRLYLSCLQRSKLQYPYQLLAIPGVAAELFDTDKKALKNPQGYSCGTVGSYLRRYPGCEKRLKGLGKVNLKRHNAVPVILYGTDNPTWKEEQIRNILRDSNARPVPPEFTLNDIRSAVQERVLRGLLRPEDD